MTQSEHFTHTYEGSLRAHKAGDEQFDTMQGQEVWLQAETLQQFGEATALWLEGGIGRMPTCAGYAHPNDESMPLLPYLNPLNRSGLLVSTFSQPGCTLDSRPYGGIMDEQRAVAGGYMYEQHLEELGNQADHYGVKMVFGSPGAPSRTSYIPVSRRDGQEITFTGDIKDADEIASRYGSSQHTEIRPGLSKVMIAELQSCAQIDVYDEDWGRNDRLWPMLKSFFEKMN